MPKDPAKNIDRYKIRGGVINEYEYHENQQSLATDEPQKATKSSKNKKTAKRVANRAITGASAKKLAARKAARH